MSAISAMEQPALRSGRMTVWCSRRRISALSAMKCTPEDDIAALGLRCLEGEFEGITAEVGELDDLVALVVMAQNDNVVAETGFGGSDAVIEGIVWHQEVGIEVASYAGFDFGGVEGGRLVYADEDAAIRYRN